jgi:Uma2 family endonuclease
MSADDYHRLCGQSDEWADTNLIYGIVHQPQALAPYHQHAVNVVAELLRDTHPSLRIYTRVRMRYGEYCSLVADVAAFNVDPELMSAEEPARGNQEWAIDIVHSDFDFVPKLKVYAQHRVPEYWVIDWEQGHVDRHSRPAQGVYGQVVRVPLSEVVSL